MSLASIPFIFIFLPVFIALYYLVPRKWWRTLVLFVGSLFCCFWIDPGNLLVMAAAALFNYVFGLVIFRTSKGQVGNRTALIFTVIAIVLDVSLLVFYKYSGFLTSILAGGMHLELQAPALALPVGISYFTFTGISYLVDVYHGATPAEKRPIRFLNYMLMFPKLLLGPITQYGQVTESLADKWFINDNFVAGMKRFSAGLAKKVIVADNLAVVANKVFASDFSLIGPGVSWFGLISYALQIFFDFSGYTDMALGLGMMLGYRLPENFDYPYISKSVTEFWRRWHMSLTGWFRTYIFIPLEFKWRRAGWLRQPLTILVVFLLTGLWHGAGWNFILWGGYFGILLTLEALGLGKLLKRLPAILQHFYALFFIWVGWVFFKITDIGQWGGFLKALFGINKATGDVTLRSLNILLYIPMLLLGFLFMTPVVKKLEGKILSKGIWGKIIIALVYVGLFALSIGYLLSGGYVSFLYSQF